MNLFRALKAINPGGRIKRADWPSDLFVYVTPKTEIINIQLFRGRTSYAADHLAEPDFKANDWLIVRSTSSKD